LAHMVKRLSAMKLGLAVAAIAFLAVIAVGVSAAVDQPSLRPTTDAQKLFATHVRSILEVHCVKCHGGEKTQGELDLTTREGLLKGGENGAVVTLGNGKESRIYKLITHAEDPKMPKKA